MNKYIVVGHHPFKSEGEPSGFLCALSESTYLMSLADAKYLAALLRKQHPLYSYVVMAVSEVES